MTFSFIAFVHIISHNFTWASVVTAMSMFVRFFWSGCQQASNLV